MKGKYSYSMDLQMVEVSKTQPIFEMGLLMKWKRTTSLIIAMKRGHTTAQLTPVWLLANELAEVSTKMRRQPANTGELSDPIDP